MESRPVRQSSGNQLPSGRYRDFLFQYQRIAIQAMSAGTAVQRDGRFFAGSLSEANRRERQRAFRHGQFHLAGAYRKRSPTESGGKERDKVRRLSLRHQADGFSRSVIIET